MTDDRDDPLPSNVLPFVIPKPETEEEKKASVDRMLALFPPTPETAAPPKPPGFAVPPKTWEELTSPEGLAQMRPECRKFFEEHPEHAWMMFGEDFPPRKAEKTLEPKREENPPKGGDDGPGDKEPR